MNEKMWNNFILRSDKYYSLKVAFRHFTIAKSKLLRILYEIEKEEK